MNAYLKQAQIHTQMRQFDLAQNYIQKAYDLGLDLYGNENNLPVINCLTQRSVLLLLQNRFEDSLKIADKA